MNSPCTWDLDKYEDGDFIAHYAEEHSLDKYERLALQLATMNLWMEFIRIFAGCLFLISLIVWTSIGNSTIAQYNKLDYPSLICILPSPNLF
jgi:hypothetical protein